MAIFPIVQSIEFYINKIKGTIKDNATWISLSKQQIIDCCENCLNQSDNKPFEAVYKYIMEHGLV
jgi:hypothetical protein